jgi:hypothetical protein
LTLAETIRALPDADLVEQLKAMRRFSARGHYAYSINIHMACKDECKRREIEI